MKKEAILILLIILLGVCSAVSLEIENPNSQPEETFLAKLTGDFAEAIPKSNLEFYEKNRRVYPEHDIIFYGDTYYFYTYFTREANFTIKINNILYREPELKSTNIEETLEVKKRPLENNKTQILSIKPGFIFTSEDAEITLSNKGTESLNITYDSNNITLKPGNYEKYIFKPTQAFSQLVINTYTTFTIPVIYAPLTTNQSQNQIFTGDLQPSITNLTIKLISGESKKQTLTLENTGNATIEDIVLTSNLSMLEIPEIDKLNAAESVDLDLEILSKEEGFFAGSLMINYLLNSEEKFIDIPIEVYVFPKDTPENQTTIKGQTCEEINAISCKEDEKCKGITAFTDTKPTKYCCKGTCVGEDSNNNDDSGPNWYLGILIFAIAALLIFIVYKKFKTTSPETPEQQFQQTTQSYENRISGGIARS